MPYRTIHWIKLEKRLLNDYRFYVLSESAQLIYIKLLLLAAETDNKIPQNLDVLKSCFRSSLNTKEIENCIKEILKNFPKFVQCKDFYRFKEWSTRTNFIWKKELPGNSLGNSGDTLDKIRIEEIRKEYVALVGHNLSTYTSSDYGRTGKAIKKLFIRANYDIGLIKECLNWIAKQGYSWTLETCDKKWHDFINFKEGRSINNTFDVPALIQR